MSVLNTYDTTAGNREDIYDVLQLVSPEETPLFTRLPDAVANGILHQWVEYTLVSGSGNQAVEGATTTGSTSSSKARVSNYTQINTKNGAVSGTQRKVTIVGEQDEFAFQMKKAMLEWKIEAENDLINSSGTSGDDTHGRKTDGLITALLPYNVVTGSATTVALTETLFNNLLQSIFEAGAVADTCYVAGFNKRRISQFATTNVRFLDVDSSGLIRNRVSAYDSDFGTIEVILERYVPKTDGLILKDSLFRKAWLRKPVTYPLAKRGDLDEFQIVGEWCLEHLNARAGGLLSAFASATS
jgi:uncharacterized protein DUF5309